MQQIDFREKALHGTKDFPIAIYNNTFDAGQKLLAPLHYHSEFELFLVTEGHISVQTENTTYRLAAREALFIHSGQLHTITAEPDAQTAFTAIVFGYQCLCNLNDLLYNKYIHPLMSGQYHIEQKLSPELARLIQEINLVFQAAESGFEFRVKELLLSCFRLLLKDCTSASSPSASRKSTLVREILDYMEANYQEQLTLEDMADHVHISKEYLCRVFHQMAGASPIAYLNGYRIRKSAELLLETDSSITEIAFLCGFHHSSYFDKLFFNYMGCRPGDYRRKAKTTQLTSKA